MFGQGPFGAYALGQPAPDLYTLRLGVGSFTLTPKTVSNPKILRAAASSFSLYRKTATLVYHPKGDALAGALVLSGSPVLMTYMGGSGLRGIITTRATFALSGNPSSSIRLRIMSADPGALTLTPKPATILPKRKLSVAKGVFALAPQTANLIRSQVARLAAGSFMLTGRAANGGTLHVLNVSPGALTLAANDARSIHTPLRAAPVAFSTAPNPVEFLRGRIMVATPGRYVLTAVPGIFPLAAEFTLAPQRATMRRMVTLATDPGNLSIDGQNIIISKVRQLIAGTGRFLIPDAPTSYSLTRQLAADPGALTLAGVDNLLQPTYAIIAEPAAYDIAPVDAVMLSARVLSGMASSFMIRGRDATEISAVGVAAAVWGRPVAVAGWSVPSVYVTFAVSIGDAEVTNSSAAAEWKS